MNLRLASTAMLAVLSFAAGPGLAADYPDHAITVIVPYAPGGADRAVRTIGTSIQERTGKTLVIENKPGGSGTVGTTLAARSDPDGYTFLGTVDIPMVRSPAMMDVAYDPVEDFEPVSVFAIEYSLLVASKALGASTLDEVVAIAKERPDGLLYASGAYGSAGHLCMELVRKATGMNLTLVPYNGGAPAAAAVIGGQVDLYCGAISGLLSNAQEGNVVALAYTGDAPSPLMPDVPTLSSKWPEMVFGTWHGIFAPKGTPQEAIDWMAGEVKASLDTPAVSDQLNNTGTTTMWAAGEDAEKIVETDLESWGSLITELGIKAQ